MALPFPKGIARQTTKQRDDTRPAGRHAARMNIDLDYSLTRSLTAFHHGQNAVSARPHGFTSLF